MENAIRLHFNGDANARAATTNVERLYVIFAVNLILKFRYFRLIPRIDTVKII